MNIVIGKRYCWNSYTDNSGRYYHGICEFVDYDNNIAYFVTNNEKWAIPIEKGCIIPYKKFSKNKKRK